MKKIILFLGLFLGLSTSLFGEIYLIKEKNTIEYKTTFKKDGVYFYKKTKFSSEDEPFKMIPYHFYFKNDICKGNTFEILSSTFGTHSYRNFLISCIEVRKHKKDLSHYEISKDGVWTPVLKGK